MKEFITTGLNNNRKLKNEEVRNMSSRIPTPHINAPEGAFADTVLMPGDPLRSRFIAEQYLENAELINNVRGVQGYTGTYKGKKVSVMASGMGCPSIGIYSYELFNFYDVKNIIRIGSAGAISPKLKLKDIVIGMSAYTDSGYISSFGFRGNVAPCCSYEFCIYAEKSKIVCYISAYSSIAYRYPAGIRVTCYKLIVWMTSYIYI